MNTEEWIQRLAPLTTSPYLQQIAQAAADFESFAITIRLHHNLAKAYSIGEVMLACKEVCAHQGVPSLQTMDALAGGHNTTLIRDFICELGKITTKSQ